MRFRAAAPAKVNLYLHVVGKRPDGYHLLDSLFAFTEYGDVAEAFPSDGLSLEIKGPFAAGLPSSADNIVIKAALKLAEAAGIEPKARIVLQKKFADSFGNRRRVVGRCGDSDGSAKIMGMSPVRRTFIGAGSFSRRGRSLVPERLPRARFRGRRNS